jgi:hypothetical protein
MTFTHTKRAFALVGALAASTAFASGPDYQFVDGDATLSFTSSSLQTLGIAGISVTGIAPATFDGSKITMTSQDSLVGWNANYDVQSLGGLGGFRLTSSTVQGAKVDITNVRFDLPSDTIFVDAKTYDYSSAFGNYQGSTFAGLALFKGVKSNAAYNIVAANGQLSGSLLDLKLSAGAIPVLGDALGVPQSIQQALFPTLNFGRVDLRGTFVPSPVPEPSTYALFALGGLALAGAARRKARAAH